MPGCVQLVGKKFTSVRDKDPRTWQRPSDHKEGLWVCVGTVFGLPCYEPLIHVLLHPAIPLFHCTNNDTCNLR